LAASLGLSQAQAQEKPDEKKADDEPILMGEFVVKGVRASMIGAQEIKQSSTLFVDSIVAQDIGKLPDNSVADALQRVSGVQVGHNNGEVQSVLIRGLPDVATTLNGHEIFTGVNRGVALQDIGAEVVAGVDVFKSSQPDQIEGGIAGLVDIRLRRPFDFKGLQVAAGGRLVQGEHADKMGYVASALFSDRWKTSGGEFGALYSFSHDNAYFVDEISFNYSFDPVSVTTGTPPTTKTYEIPFTQGAQIIPGNRQRTSHTVALQWKPNKDLEIYSDWLVTGYKQESEVDFLVGLPRFGAWQSVEAGPAADPYRAGIPVANKTVSVNNFHINSTQAFDNKTNGYQGVLGAKLTKSNFKGSTELVYNWSEVKTQRYVVDTQFNPSATTPGQFATFTFNNNDGGMANLAITGADINNPNNLYLWGWFDNRTKALSKEIAWRADGDFTIGDGFIRSIKGGVRFTSRSAKSEAVDVNDVGPAAGRGVQRVTQIPGFITNVTVEAPFDDYGVKSWATPNADYIRANAGALRTQFGLPTAEPNFELVKTFDMQEDTQSVYAQANYKTSLGDMPLDGLFGARVVRTASDMTGYTGNTVSTQKNAEEDQTDLLPTLTALLKIRNNLQSRFSAGRTVTRPQFAQLNPAVSYSPPVGTQPFGSASGGNPDLKTVKSDNYDLSLEYYFAKSAFVSASAFYRSIDGYIVNFATLKTYDIGNGQGPRLYNDTRPKNSGKGHLQGLEFSYQHFPEFFPAALKGLGWQLNATYTTGKTQVSDPSFDSSLNPNGVPALVEKDFPGVAEWAYNAVGIYERGRFSARLAYNWRGEFTATYNNGANLPPSPLQQVIVKSFDTLDFSASYEVVKNLTITLDMTNLLESRYQDYFYNPAYPRDTRAYDRTISMGVRYHF
jgi:TonB-dependent receptor